MYEESKGGDAANSASTNPFRMLNKKDKDHQQVVGSNLDVKRVKYTNKNQSPGEEKHSPPGVTAEEEKKGTQQATASPFVQQNAGGNQQKDTVRFGGPAKGRRAGPQAERTRQQANRF